VFGSLAYHAPLASVAVPYDYSLAVGLLSKSSLMPDYQVNLKGKLNDAPTTSSVRRLSHTTSPGADNGIFLWHILEASVLLAAQILWNPFVRIPDEQYQVGPVLGLRDASELLLVENIYDLSPIQYGKLFGLVQGPCQPLHPSQST
jgi:hypothetical protein